MPSPQKTGAALLSPQRHLFDIPDDVAFLNCAYMSPLPKVSVAAGERGLARKVQPWMITSDDFFSASEAVRARFAGLINAAPDDVAFAPSVSYGMAQAAANIALARTQTIVTLAEQFPSNVYPWMELAARTGAQFIAVPRPGDDNWTAALLAAINTATGVVAVPHCHWTDGGLIDLEAVGAACRRVGAVLCVDGTQSVGALPFDVRRIDPDYLAVASYKWLLGPYSFGFLYVAPRRQAGRPIEHNWIARRGSQDFAGLVNYQTEFQDGARRFDVGERGNFALMPVADASLKLIADWTVPRILATLARRTEAIAARARAEFRIDSVPSGRRAGHYLGLRFRGGFQPTCQRSLRPRRCMFRYAAPPLRVTPHLWTTDADVERLFAALRGAVA